MRFMRERSAALGSSPAAGPVRRSAGMAGCALVGGGGASSGKLKVFQTKKEKNKRRLIMSDSESDDFPVSPHGQRVAVAEAESMHLKGKGSAAGKMQFEGSSKNGKKAGVSGKAIGQRDVVKYRQDGSINLKSSVCLGMERKRSHESSQNGVEDDGMSLKRIKMESLKCGRDQRGQMDAERMRLDSVRCGVGKSLIRTSRLPASKQVMSADEESESFGKKRMHAHLKGNRSYEAEEGTFLEHSNQKMYRSMQHNISSSSTKEYSVSSDGTSLRLQGKGGVLRLLPNNKKFVGHMTSHVEGESDESRKSPGSSGVAYKSTFSEGGKFFKKSGSSSVTDESGKSPQFSGGSDQRTRHLSLSEGRKSLKRIGYSSMTEEAKKSPWDSGFSKQIMPKCLSLYKDRKYLKTRDSPIKEEKRKDPQHSGGAVRVRLKHSTTSEDRISLKKKSESSTSEHARKGPGHSSCAATFSEERKPLKNPGCSSTKEKSHVEPKGKGLKLKESDSLSPQRNSKNVDNICKRTEVKDRKAGKFVTKALVSSENNTPSEKVSRRTEKQQLRDHIKTMLLNASWKIEMRPRRGRNYEDAVYVSPQGTGYWSITKAYSVFQEQCNKNDDMENEEGEESDGQLPKESSTNACNHNGIASQFSAIPSEMLKILKRNVVKKRGRMEDDEKDSGKRVSSKSAKNKKVVAIKKRISENGIVGSSRKKNKNGRGCTLLARTSHAEADSEDDDYVPYAGKRSVLAWMIDSETVPANGKVKYMNRRRTRTMLEGLITRDGIHCSCCSKVLTVSKFEIHAGSKLNQPYANIFVEESRASLLQCQLDAWDRQKESERCSFHLIDITDDDPNDDTCAICGDGGDLICCDSCPSTFHLSCLGIKMLPPGDWNCMNCLCRFCGVASSSTVEGDNVTNSLLPSCGLCEGKYHQACIPDADATPVDSSSSSLSFCGQNCRKLFEHLQNRLGVKNDLDAGFSWTLVKRFDDEPLSSCSNLAQRAECNSKIAVALAVMNECFLPIIDRRSGINLIHNVLYNRGSNFSRLSYSGFYTFILERGDEIICAASIRIHGTRLAEMPFIGTRDMYRRQGMCRRLLNVIEETLGALKIEKLVIPAISELMHTWTMVFGFKPLDDSDKQEVKSMNMLVFPDTGLLQKLLVGQGSYTAKEGLGPVENDTAMVSNEYPDPHTSNDGTVCCSLEIRNEIGIKRPSLPSSNSSVQENPEYSCQPSDMPSDAPLKSDKEALRYKSLETAPDGASSVDGPLDDAEVQCRDHHATHPRAPTVDKLSIQDSDVIGQSFDTSTFAQNIGETTHHNSSKVANESSLPPVSSKTPAFDVAPVLDTHKNEGEVSALDNMLNCDSRFIPEAESVSLGGAVDVPSADSLEPNLHRSVDVALHDTANGLVEVSTIESDTCVFRGDSHLCDSEAFALQMECVHRVNACESVPCETSEIISHHGHRQSKNGLQISDHCVCQGSKLPWGSPEFSCDTVLPCTSHSFNERILQSAHEINNERSVRDHTFDVDDESLGAASKYDLPVPCADKSQKMSDNSSSATHAQTVDACMDKLHEAQKGLQVVIHPSEFSTTDEDTLVDKHGVENGASFLSNCQASIEEYKCCTTEVTKPSGSVPGDRCSF